MEIKNKSNKISKFEKQIQLFGQIIEKKLKDYGIDSEEKRKDLSKGDFDKLFENDELNLNSLLKSNLFEFLIIIKKKFQR